MSAFAIDLGAPFYWVFVAIAVIVLSPIVRCAPRRVALALFDLLFITLLTAPWGGFVAAGYAFVMHRAAIIAQGRDARGAWRQVALTLGAALVLALFLAHKLALPSPDVATRAPLARLLVAVGFSYVALRSVELLRAGAERTVSNAGWLDAVSYLFPFHMLAAGPIQSWTDFTRWHGVEEPLTPRTTLYAIDRIARGLFKKFVLARLIELTLLTRFTAPWPYQLLEVQVYYLWVYLDFSAYSDLAAGTGKLLGVATPENFNKPLGARNIVVFWERWHISLSAFVRRNIFIPFQLAAMRRSKGRHPWLIASTAFAVSFLLIGLWHGVSLRFLLWGAMHAIALIICNTYQRAFSARWGRQAFASYLSKPAYRVLATILTFEFVAFSLAFIVHPATAFLDRTP